MRYKTNTYKLLVVALFAVFVASCKPALPHEGKIVFTQVPADALSELEARVPEFQYAEGMQLMMAELSERPESFISLTADFHSARAPEISYDGRSMVFSGQKSANDTWQIWIMDLENREFHQVTQSTTNCTDPAWAPDGSVVYSKMVNERQNSLKHHALFKIGADGCCDQRITFHPHEDLNAAFLNDGRIIVQSTQIFPEKTNASYLAMRPDGTKAELFYQSENAREIQGSATDNFSGKVLFCESGELASVNFSRPLHTRQRISSEPLEFVQSAYPMDNGVYLLSGLKPVEKTYGISVRENTGEIKMDLHFADHHIFEPVVIEKRTLGRKLPSRVNTDLESGYLICMNSDDSQISLNNKKIKSARIQVLGMDEVIGESPIEDDGSFYLEMKADVPVRLQTLNADGEVVRGPSAWMWVRPNERRGCVGCHANPEYAPENVVPKAIEKAPYAMIN